MEAQAGRVISYRGYGGARAGLAVAGVSLVNRKGGSWFSSGGAGFVTGGQFCSSAAVLAPCYKSASSANVAASSASH